MTKIAVLLPYENMAETTRKVISTTTLRRKMNKYGIDSKYGYGVE